MKLQIRLTIVASLLALVFGQPANAELPASYLKRWNDPVVQQRIDQGIENIYYISGFIALIDVFCIRLVGCIGFEQH